MKKYNFYKNIGINNWYFNFPIIFKENTPIRLTPNIRLLIITHNFHKLLKHKKLIKNVINSMKIKFNEICQLHIDKISKIPINNHFHTWWIDCLVIRKFNGITLISEKLNKLKQNIFLKQKLWNKIILYYKKKYDKLIFNNKINIVL